MSDNLITPGGNKLCDGCNVREPFEHRCHNALCLCTECREADRLFSRSCPQHPQWSGMAYDCAFCRSEEDGE